MRTEQVGLNARVVANTKVKVKDTSGAKSKGDVERATQYQPPHEAAEADLLGFLQKHPKNGNPFEVSLASQAQLSRTKKRKRDQYEDYQFENNLLHDTLAVYYHVQRADKWKSMKNYKKATVGKETIVKGDCIFVRHNDEGDVGEEVDMADQWKAIVLEMRALDPRHAFVRVAWLNRPEDLEIGRQRYHGRNELIPTNQMDIIEASSINGKFEIVHRDENDKELDLVADDQYFWRQTFDFNANRLSRLNMICKDLTPVNPDEMIIQCANKFCCKWQHVKCMAESAVEVAASTDEAETQFEKRAPKNIISPNLAAATAVKGAFTSEVYIAGELSNAMGLQPATDTEVIITKPDVERHAIDLQCLFCSETVD